MISKVKLDKRWKEILYAATGFGPNLLMVLLTAYFTDAIIPTSLKADIDFWSYGGTILVSTIIFPILWTLGRIFDGVVDVPLAAFTDNLKNKTGKRWLGIVIAVAPMIVSYVLCWIPIFGNSGVLTLGQQIGNSIWIFFWSIIFFASYTLALITFYGSLSDVCEDQTQRARVSAYKSVFDTISYALVYAAIPAVFKAAGVSIWKVAIFMSPLMLSIIIPLFMGKKDNQIKTTEQIVKDEDKRVNIWESIVLTVRSKPFLKWLFVNCISFFGLQMFLVSQNALISGVMQLGAGYAAILNTAAFAPVPIMLVLFNKVRKSKGIRFAYQTALIAFAIAILSFCLSGTFIWGDQLAPKLIIGSIGGVIGSWGIGAFFMVPYLIPTSIASVEEEIIGKNHSAMYFAIQALATSIVGAISSSLIYDYLKLWVEHPENINTDADLGWRYGVSLVPFIVCIACLIGFFACFRMPKSYTPSTIYNDIKSSSEKVIVRLNKKKEIFKSREENEVSKVQNSTLSDEEKNILIENIHKKYQTKIAQVSYDMIPYQNVVNMKFDAENSKGNEESLIIEKNSTFGHVALFVLSGGLFNYVSFFIDAVKFKVLEKKIKWYQLTLLILSGFIPFLSIYTAIFFDNFFKEYEINKKVTLSRHRVLNIVTSIFLPCFLNPVELATRTICFNEISDDLIKN